MQIRLLSLLDDLKKQNTPLCGVWLIHTDDPLVIDWLISMCRPLWSKNNQFIKRMELTSPKSWHEVVYELSSLSLFDECHALIVTGKHKFDTKDKMLMALLTQFAQDVQNGQSHHHLIWCLPKQDKKSLATKAIDFFDKNGLVIDGNIYDERLRRELLNIKAQEFGLTLDDMAWQILMSATEKNLLMAYQTLWRLSFLSHDKVCAKELELALVSGVDFNVFDLSDALLTANVAKVLQILTHLKNTDIAPSLILWAIAKEARLILQLQAGKNPHELGIWQNKVHLYTNAANRTYGLSHDWLSQIYALDKTIKGVNHTNVWCQFEQLCLMVCGIHQTLIDP